jgi:hypothetical protein
MRHRSASFAVAAITSVAVLSANAVCLDEAGISGFHIPPEKESREAYAVVIGTVVGVKEGPAPLEGEDGEGTVYRLRVEETLRGRRHKSFALFSENTTARFPMKVGRRYLVFVTAHDNIFYASNCGNSGELGGRSKLIEDLRKRPGLGGKG